jgi:hypothetical protein
MEENKILKIYNNKIVGIIFVLLNILVIGIEILIILKILPYNVIGGGNLKNYGSALRAAIMSIIILGIEIITIISIMKLNKNGKTNIFIKIILWIIFSILCLNTIGNILSKTLFEKVFMGTLCIIQIINIIRIILENKLVKRNYIINVIRNEYKKIGIKK